MNRLKCILSVSSGKFLGIIVQKKGIDLDPAKAIQVLKPPTTCKQLKSFMKSVSCVPRVFLSWISSLSHSTTLAELLSYTIYASGRLDLLSLSNWLTETVDDNGVTSVQ